MFPPITLQETTSSTQQEKILAGCCESQFIMWLRRGFMEKVDIDQNATVIELSYDGTIAEAP